MTIDFAVRVSLNKLQHTKNFTFIIKFALLQPDHYKHSHVKDVFILLVVTFIIFLIHIL